MEPRHDPTGFRTAMGLFGFAAGVALWVLSDFVLGALGNPRLELLLSATAVAYFLPALLLSGPMSMPRALVWALAPGVIAPALLVWSSLRFDTLSELGGSPLPLAAFFVLVVMSLPYLVALERRETFSYTILFNEAWRIVIRAVAAGLFIGVFWGVYMISNLLLSLVGLDLLDDLLDRREFVFGVSGFVVGLALSVLYEQRAYLSPVLLMRLLQLLLIPVAGVVLVFVLRVPFQGLDVAFSGLSAAATLMAMTLALATLISAALDCEFGDEPPSQLVLISAQVACLLMPVLAGLAAYAIWIRVEAHGWTPQRVAAALLCCVTLAYAVGYAVGVLQREGWDDRLRRVNVWIGLGILMLAAVSLTPVLDAERISARDQVARYESGRSSAESLPLFEMTSQWGRAGRAGLERLEATAEPTLARMIEDLRQNPMPVARGSDASPEQRAALARLVSVRPEDASVPEALFADLPVRFVSDWLTACSQGVGRCVAVVTDSVAAFPGPETYMLVWTPFGDFQGYLIVREPRGDLSVRPLATDGAPQAEALMRLLLAGEFEIVAPRMPALRIGDQEFIAVPR
jgi:hypothetical protein